MSNRNRRAQIARETLDLFEKGSYTNNKGLSVNIADQLHFSVEETLHLQPEDFKYLPLEGQMVNTTFEIHNETTLEAAYRLIHQEKQDGVAALNFASAKNPGGGFLNGSQAQEESLARASGMYLCQTAHMEMYETNRKNNSCLYSDHMLYSPKVPVIRNDEDQLLDTPYLLSIITAPAVNTGCLVQHQRMDELQKVDAVMLERTRKLLTLALSQNHSTLILGAWGCGVFRNDPVKIAGYFKSLLKDGGDFENRFQRIVFAVLDPSKNQEIFKAFESTFDFVD
ncbi:TIGR02452 family protein [Rapidithrix thailandica]|uniref:TIGR02452 family protein n=1 Tax=Rapidithrix thailandica TaxID=413964 RepID=A0AAW9RZM1_9BACT